MKTFLGLSSERAYRRFYPAIDPLISWSRYLDQLKDWFTKELGAAWTADVKAMRDLLHQGDSINQMMQVTGEEGITMEDYLIWHKANLLDMVYLQQDAFDEVDVSMSRERQLESFNLLKSLIAREYQFKDKDAARDFFTRLAGLYKNFNYSRPESPEYQRYRQQIEQLSAEHSTLSVS